MKTKVARPIGLMLAIMMIFASVSPELVSAATENVGSASNSGAMNTGRYFRRFAKPHGEVKDEEPEENTAVVMFEGDIEMTKKSAKKALSSGSDAVTDIRIDEIWNFDEAEGSEESTPGKNLASDDGDTDVDTVALVKSDKLSTNKLIKALKKNKNVKYAEPNFKIHALSVTDDTYIDHQWSMQDSTTDLVTPNVSKAWENSTGSEESIVAILDSGVDYEHEDLKDNIWENEHIPQLKGEHGYDFINGDADPMDDNGHGTHVAGIIGASGNNGKYTSGVNQKVKIMALKMLDAGGSATLVHEVAAYHYINKAIDLGEPVKAINNSWGGGEYSEIFEELVNIVGEKGAITCCAAGNDGSSLDEYSDYPASIDSPYLVTVAATREDGKLASFSNYGSDVDVAAPGADILSLAPGNVYNPTIYGDKQNDISDKFNDFEGAETWGKPRENGSKIMLNGAEYTGSEDQVITSDVTAGGFESYRSGSSDSLEVNAKDLKANDLVCVTLPYTLSADATMMPHSSIMVKPYAPEGAAGFMSAPVFGIMDVKADTKLDMTSVNNDLQIGMYIDGESDVWEHLSVAAPDENLTGEDQERMLVIVLYANTAGDYGFRIDDIGMSKQKDITEDDFGKTEYMSGTSMACPYMTGAIALKYAELGTDADPEEVINKTVSLVNDEHQLNVEPKGSLDFSKIPTKYPPRISGITVDPDGDTITIKGLGFADDQKIYMRNADDDEAEYEELSAQDIISVGANEIVIKGASWINNIADIKIEDGSKASERKQVYLVRGKKKYDEAGMLMDMPSNVLTTDGKYIYTINAGGAIERIAPNSYTDEEAETMGTIEGAALFNASEEYGKQYASMTKSDLVYSNNKLFVMLEYGEANEKEEAYDDDVIIMNSGRSVTIGGDEDEEMGGGLSIYSGETRLVVCDMNLDKVYSVKLPQEMSKREDYTLAQYNGKIYVIGGYDYNKASKGLSTAVKVYDPVSKKWSNGPALPSGKGRAAARALQSGNKLILTLGYSEDQSGKDLTEQECPANLIFDGKAWKEVGESGDLDPYADVVSIKRGSDEYWVYDASIGLAKNGLAYFGAPFSDYGDTFTYNMNTGKYKDTGYNYIEKVSGDEIYGTTVGNKIYGFYDDYMFTAPVASGLVKVTKSVTGKGTVTGAKNYCPGNDAKITVKAKKWNHIKSIKAGGKTIKVKKNAKKKTFKISKLTKNAKVVVKFAKDKKVKVTVIKKGKGTVKGAGKYYIGKNVKIKVKAAKGYKIKSIKSAGKKIKVKKNAAKKEFTIKKIKKATKIKVVFVKK